MVSRIHDKLISDFEVLIQSRENQEKRDKAIEQIAERLPRCEAKATLLMLLDRYGIKEPELSDDTGGFRPDSWRQKAFNLLCKVICDAEEGLELLDQLARHGTSAEKRREALEHLAKRFRDRREAFECACFCADNGMTALGCLMIARDFPSYPESWPFITRILGNWGSWVEDRMAIEALIKHHSDHPKTVPLLENIALHGIDRIGPNCAEPRELAVRAMVEFRAKDATLLEDLKRIALDAPLAPWGSVFGAIAEHYREHTETLAYLLDNARSHDDHNARWSAVNSLMRFFAEDDRVVSEMILLSASDESFQQRLHILILLMKHHGTAPRIRHHILERLRSDNHPHVRETIVRHLAGNYPDDEECVAALMERVKNDPDETVRKKAKDFLAYQYKVDVASSRH